MKNHCKPSLSPEEAERRHKKFVEGGRKGGSVKCKKGFACNRALAAEAGRKGGKISRKGPKNGK